MKKLISLLLAVSLMAMSSVAFAAGDLGTENSNRNPGGWSDTTGNRNSNVLRTYSHVPSQLAVYRPGDTIQFNRGSGNTVADGDVITFISSYLGAQGLDNASVMFIDQVTKEPGVTFKPSYKIREGLAEGIYKLDIKFPGQDAYSVYYAVVDPKVTILTTDAAGKQTYTSADGTTYYFATAQLGAGQFMYEQAGVAEYGFDFGNGNVFTYYSAVFDEFNATQEVNGAVNWLFSIGVTDVEGTAPTAAGVIVDE